MDVINVVLGLLRSPQAVLTGLGVAGFLLIRADSKRLRFWGLIASGTSMAGIAVLVGLIVF
jgi:hypothetical protein